MQEIIVLAFIGAAVAYVSSMIYMKTRSFSSKAGCANDCDCSANKKDRQMVAE